MSPPRFGGLAQAGLKMLGADVLPGSGHSQSAPITADGIAILLRFANTENHVNLKSEILY